jgi:hypothetical protein
MKSAQEIIESTISPSAAEEIQSLSLSLSLSLSNLSLITPPFLKPKEKRKKKNLFL